MILMQEATSAQMRLTRAQLPYQPMARPHASVVAAVAVDGAADVRALQARQGMQANRMPAIPVTLLQVMQATRLTAAKRSLSHARIRAMRRIIAAAALMLLTSSSAEARGQTSHTHTRTPAPRITARKLANVP